MKNNKKLMLGLSIALAIVMTLSATFAWFTANDSKRNHLETAQISDGSASIYEVFVPPTEWKPGQSITKQVAVSNSGTSPILVRVSFEEVMNTLKLPVQTLTTPATGDAIPQAFNATPYLSAPWQDPGDLGLTVNGLPSGVTVKVLKQVENEGTPQEKITYTFVPLYAITSGTYAGTYQRVTADFFVSGATVTASNVKFYQYEGRNIDKKAWAVFAVPQESSATVATPLSAAIDNPITDVNKKITIDYTNATAAKAAAPVVGEWWYDSTDGFFYFIGVVEPGTVSKKLMESLTLATGAGNEYSGMKFDLIVNLEAIQNTVDAITATDGWGLTNTDLITALTAYCE